MQGNSRRARREIRSLTGLRGVAACFVMVFHFTGGTEQGNVFLGHGYLMVDLFFALSGFVMAMTYASTFKHDLQRADYAAFLLHRVARIYPLYLAMTLLICAMAASGISHIEGLEHPLRDLPSNLLLVQCWGMARSIDGAAWSISTEWAAYLLFPLMASVALFRGQRVALAGLAGALGIVVLIVVLPTAVLGESQVARQSGLNVFDYHTLAPLLRCLAGFFAGLVAYRWAGTIAGVASRTVGWFADGTACVIAIALAFRSGDLVCWVLFPVLVLLLSRGSGMLARLLGSRPIHLLGVLSYAIYLVHLSTVRVRLAAAAAAGHYITHTVVASVMAGCAASILMAVIAHLVIERPGRTLIRRISHVLIGRMSKRMPVPAADASASQAA